MQVNAILFDVQSIQKYIFANNKLKANVGASYIVDRLFENVLCDDVIKNLGVAADTTSWLVKVLRHYQRLSMWRTSAAVMHWC